MKKGSTKPNALYFKRETINGKYRYWYSAQEYNTWLKTKEGKTYLQSKGNAAINVLNNKNRPDAKKEIAKVLSSKDQKRVSKVVNQAKAETAKKEEEKQKVKEATEKVSKSSGSSGSSSKSKGSKGSKGASSSSKGKASTGEKKESAAKKETAQKSTDTSKDATIKQLQDKIKQLSANQANKKRVLDGGVANTESLKKLYGVTESNKHASVQESIDKMKSYPDGAYGYISAGGTMYKWSKQDGKITFRDNNTDKEVALQVALTNVEEFRTDKKKKNNSLSHSFKGSVWKKHKYIRKEGRKYIYKESYVDNYGNEWDKYENPDTNESVNVNTGFTYDPDRYDREEFAEDSKSDYGTSHYDVLAKSGSDTIAKLFNKKKKQEYLAKR